MKNKDYNASMCVLAVLLLLFLLPCLGIPSHQTAAEEHAESNIGDFFANIIRGDYEEIRAALDAGIDPNSVDKTGMPALVLAGRTGNQRITALLAERGAIIEAGDKNGTTALMYAAERGKMDIVRTLVARGAAVDTSDKKKRTALIYAVRGGQVEAVQFLLRVGAAVGVMDSDGCSPLTYAVKQGDPQLTKILIERGADIEHRDNEGHTALDRAKTAKNTELLRIMNFASSAAVVAERAPAPGRTVSERTRLRVLGEPKGQWHYGAEVTLQEVTASVRNVGEVKANDIRIEAVLPGGKSVVLSGPVNLERNQQAEYRYNGSQTVTSTGRMKVKSSCANCW